MKKLMMLTGCLLVTIGVNAQSEKDREKIKQNTNQQALQQQQEHYRLQHLKDSTDVANYLLAHPRARREFTRNGVYYKMVRISKNGNPLYLKTKKKMKK